MFFSPFGGPEESYSRQLDKDVAAQEHPYGKPYRDRFPMIEIEIEKVERKDKRHGKKN